MRIPKATMNLHTRLVVGFAVVGVIAFQLSTFQLFSPHWPLAVRALFRWQDWDPYWVVIAAVAGALVGHLAWVMARPLQRLSRAAAVCAVANAAAWFAFVAFTPPVDSSEFYRIDAERQKRDAGDAGLELIHDRPTIVAGRWHGTFGAVNVPDRILTLFAAETIGFSELLVRSSEYYGIDATRRESVVVAALAFVLSTALWTAIGGAFTFVRQKYRARKPTGCTDPGIANPDSP